MTSLIPASHRLSSLFYELRLLLNIRWSSLFHFLTSQAQPPLWRGYYCMQIKFAPAYCKCMLYRSSFVQSSLCPNYFCSGFSVFNSLRSIHFVQFTLFDPLCTVQSTILCVQFSFVQFSLFNFLTLYSFLSVQFVLFNFLFSILLAM